MKFHPFPRHALRGHAHREPRQRESRLPGAGRLGVETRELTATTGRVGGWLAREHHHQRRRRRYRCISMYARQWQQSVATRRHGWSEERDGEPGGAARRIDPSFHPAPPPPPPPPLPGLFASLGSARLGSGYIIPTSSTRARALAPKTGR